MLSREESEAEQAVARPQVTVIPREQHAISRKDISENALKVMYRLNKAGYEACRSLAIPKRLTTLTRDIWQLQLRMSRRQGKRAWKLLEHPKFRAAYDLLALRAEVERNAELQRLVKWWGEFQVSAPPDQKGMLNELDEEPSPRRRTRRPRKRAPRREGTA